MWDGLVCWNRTKAGDTAETPCPFLPDYGFKLNGTAEKQCNSDGKWWRHPDGRENSSWANYTNCVSQTYSAYQTVDTIYIVGYSLSLAALFIALIVFFRFRALQCTRITIHKNLFASFIINNIMWIIWYREVIYKPQVMKDNPVGCQILHVLVQYFLVTNYIWMFCEGLYLHTLLVVAFVAEDQVMTFLYHIGWLFPLLPVGIYAGVRGSSPERRIKCWADETKDNYIITIPVVISMLINLGFLINIVRVLVTKLRLPASNAPPPASHSQGTRKAVRATLILIPLLGMHYIVTPFKPQEEGSSGALIYEYITACTSSFQGFCVAMLFCFCNGEVISLIKKKYHQYQLVRKGQGGSYCMDSLHHNAHTLDTTAGTEI